MKLLFDQNLSPKLPRLLAKLYPSSAHVRDVGLRDASDSEIWQFAKTKGFVIVSKDSDFQQRSLLYGLDSIQPNELTQNKQPLLPISGKGAANKNSAQFI